MASNTEDGVVIGNFYDKYAARNPIARKLMDGFLTTLDTLIAKTQAKDIHEIGCGEGHLASHLAEKGYRIRACDFSKEIIARSLSMHGDSNIAFTVKSIYDLSASEDSAPLVVCCEVLEHLEHPEEALRKLCSITETWCVLSVPREPIWRALNLARGKYIGDLGNTPGHIQHWSKKGFVSTVSRHFDIVEVRTPFPWTMILCKAMSS